MHKVFLKGICIANVWIFIKHADTDEIRHVKNLLSATVKRKESPSLKEYVYKKPSSKAI